MLKKNWEYNGSVHQLFINSEKAYDSARTEILYNILIEFGVPVENIRIIKMYLEETYVKFLIDKYLSDAFPIKNYLKKEMLCRKCFSTLLQSVSYGRSKNIRKDRN
jgi:hypothetical protein